jgi:hypothetical protein
MEDKKIKIPEEMDVKNLVDASYFQKNELSGQPLPEGAKVMINIMPLVAGVFFAFGVINEYDDLTELKSIYEGKLYK